jgi:nitrilase
VTSQASTASVNVAVVQAGSIPFDSNACVDKAVALVAEAATNGGKVVVFPEAFIGGYPKGLN